MQKHAKATFFLLTVLVSFTLNAEDGYRLWLRYDRIEDAQRLSQFTQSIKGWMVLDSPTPTLDAASEDLQRGLNGLLGRDIPRQFSVKAGGSILLGKLNNPELAKLDFIKQRATSVMDDGYLIFTAVVDKKKVIVIAGKQDTGILYGTFHFLRLLQTQQDISNLGIASSPKIKLRVLNHWDNLDRTVERGYAGFSIWDWHKLPEYIDPRYKDYARACASIGINGSVVTNVNANALVLTPHYLEKVAALATVFRPYGIKIYLTARFSAPIEMGGLGAGVDGVH